MRRVLLSAMLVLLAGCADPAMSLRTSASEPAPPGPGGPYSGDGTVHLVAVYFSFDLEGGGDSVYGHMGGHCGFDDWTLDPPSARMDVPSDASVPTEVVIREIHPDEGDLDRVSHFGTAPVAGWEGHWNGMELEAAFDNDRTLGTVTWSDGVPRFGDVVIPSGHWLLADFTYTSDQGDGRFTVHETLHMRDLGQATVAFDRSDPMCA